MASTTSGGEKTLPDAPTEGTFTSEEAYNMVLNFTFPKQAAEAVYSGNLKSLFSDLLVGAAQVDLVKLVVKFTHNASSQSIAMGIVNENSNRSAQQVADSERGYFLMSNTFNFGVQHVVTLYVPDILSRQIQPPSSNAPGFKFVMGVSKGYPVTVIAYIKHHGPLSIYRDVNFQGSVDPQETT